MQWSKNGLRKSHELRHIIWPTRLHARAEGRLAHTAERLPQHNGAYGSTIDVKVARMNAGLPQFDLALIQAVDAAGETVAGFVHDFDGLVQHVERQHREHRPEEFGEVG